MQSPNELNPDPAHRALEARLRALPRPPVPAGLEGRLLAAIPTHVATHRSAGPTVARQGWLAVASAVAALAAVGLLAVLSWQPGEEQHVTAIAPAADELASVALSPVDRRILQGAGASTFRWPVRESTPFRALSPIPRDLLN